MAAEVTLVLGGAKSGKTAHALGLAEASGPHRIYVATAQAFDAEMQAKIDRHRAERGAGWQTAEAALDIAGALRTVEADVALLDCLTLWLSNLMHHDRDIAAETATLISTLQTAPCPVILVSNEVGYSLVPETPLGRRFRDAQGLLNQRIAAMADRVILVAAGLPLTLKPA